MFYSGSAGELLIDGKKAGRVANWSFSSSMALLDTTSLADTDRSSTPGIRSTTGSCSLFYYAEEVSGERSNDASLLLNKLIKERVSGLQPNRAAESDQVQLRLRVNDGTANGKYIEGNAWLTSVAMSMAVGAVLSAECSFEFTGALIDVVI
jgi:hypothetical protein